MFSKVIVNSIASYNFKHKHKSVNKNTLSVPYYVFNNIKREFWLQERTQKEYIKKINNSIDRNNV